MSAPDHHADPQFNAVAQEIGEATNDCVRPLVVAAAERHGWLAGHEHCLHDRVLRGLVANALVDVAQQLAGHEDRPAATVLADLLVQHIKLLTREATCLLGLVLADAADAAPSSDVEPPHAVH